MVDKKIKTANKVQGLATAGILVGMMFFGPPMLSILGLGGSILVALASCKFGKIRWLAPTLYLLTLLFAREALLVKIAAGLTYLVIDQVVNRLIRRRFVSEEKKPKPLSKTTPTPVKKPTPVKTGRITEHGVAGGGIGSNSVFSEYNTSAGVKGEKATATLFNTRFQVGGRDIHLFNSLKFVSRAMKSNADVDHALLSGKICLLIDSKLYGRGTYRLVDHDKIQVTYPNGGRKIYTNKMGAALTNFRQKFSAVGLRFPKSYILVHGGSKDGFKVIPGELGGVFLGDWHAVSADIQKTLGRAGRGANVKTNPTHVRMLNNVRK